MHILSLPLLILKLVIKIKIFNETVRTPFPHNIFLLAFSFLSVLKDTEEKSKNIPTVSSHPLFPFQKYFTLSQFVSCAFTK